MAEIGLFIIAIVLFILLFPIGVITMLLPRRNWIDRTKKYLKGVAHSLDQTGNMVCERLFNYVLIKHRIHRFGNPDETISSVLGKNKQIDNLTRVGKSLDKILDKIDSNHSLKSIDLTE